MTIHGLARFFSISRRLFSVTVGLPHQTHPPHGLGPAVVGVASCRESVLAVDVCGQGPTRVHVHAWQPHQLQTWPYKYTVEVWVLRSWCLSSSHYQPYGDFVLHHARFASPP